MKSSHLKWFALAALGIYLWQKGREQGLDFLAGDEVEGKKLDLQNVAVQTLGKLPINPEMKPHLQAIAHEILSRRGQ